MFSTDASGRGGIASVVAGLGSGEFAARYGVRLIASHRDGNAWTKIACFIRAFALLCVARLWHGMALVHVHTASRASFIRKSLLLACARWMGCRTVLHLHGGAFEQYATREAGPCLQRWIRSSFERADAVLVLSESWAHFAREFAPAAHVIVLPNAVELPELPPVAQRHPMRVLFLGRIEPAKGVEELLKAVQALVQRFPALRVVIGGDGDRSALLARAKSLGIAQNLEVPGWMARERVQAELAKASIFVLPSHQEGLPMALLEAMAAGCAVVATAVGGIPQLLQTQTNGLLIAPRDVTALTQALVMLLQDQDLCTRLGHEARATIEANFSNRVMVEKMGALYERLDGIK